MVDHQTISTRDHLGSSLTHPARPAGLATGAFCAKPAQAPQRMQSAQWLLCYTIEGQTTDLGAEQACRSIMCRTAPSMRSSVGLPDEKNMKPSLNSMALARCAHSVPMTMSSHYSAPDSTMKHRTPKPALQGDRGGRGKIAPLRNHTLNSTTVSYQQHQRCLQMFH